MIKGLRAKDVEFFVIHCSDSPPGRGDTAEDIHRWHTERGFDCVGYHKVILEDGTIEDGRPEYLRGAHAGRYNATSLGVCLVGNSVFSTHQYWSLLTVLKKWMKKYPEATAVGHGFLDGNKTCPNFDVADFLENPGRYLLLDAY